MRLTTLRPRHLEILDISTSNLSSLLHLALCPHSRSNMAAAAPISHAQNGETSTSVSPEASSAAAGAIFRKLHPESYLQRYLVKGFRPDGRGVIDWRDVSVNAGTSSDAPA